MQYISKKTLLNYETYIKKPTTFTLIALLNHINPKELICVFLLPYWLIRGLDKCFRRIFTECF